MYSKERKKERNLRVHRDWVKEFDSRLKEMKNQKGTWSIEKNISLREELDLFLAWVRDGERWHLGKDYNRGTVKQEKLTIEKLEEKLPKLVNKTIILRELYAFLDNLQGAGIGTATGDDARAKMTPIEVTIQKNSDDGNPSGGAPSDVDGAATTDDDAATADDRADPADDRADPADDGAATADDGADPPDDGAATADDGADPADDGAATAPGSGDNKNPLGIDVSHTDDIVRGDYFWWRGIPKFFFKNDLAPDALKMKGLFISAVTNKGLAEKKGVMVGDYIIKFDGHDINHDVKKQFGEYLRDANKKLRNYKPVNITLLRMNDRMNDRMNEGPAASGGKRKKRTIKRKIHHKKTHKKKSKKQNKKSKTHRKRNNKKTHRKY